jgi:hypothetical protein
MVPYSTLNLREFRDILNFTTRYLIPLNFNGIDLVRRLISTLNAQPRNPTPPSTATTHFDFDGRFDLSARDMGHLDPVPGHFRYGAS